jgi:1-acyl-sn-glycerol-3-phosphate acyltransferase
MKKILQFLFSIYAMITFLAVMFFIFPFVIIASFFGKYTGGNIANKLCSVWAIASTTLWGMPNTTYNRKHLKNKTAVIYVLNHNSYMDIPLMMKIFYNINIRVLAKSELAKVPIFGFIYKRAAIMVDRSSDEARAKSIENLKEMLAKNISVAIYPEGTFNMTDKPLKEFYNGAFKIAVETQTPIQPILLLNALDRLHYNSVFSFNPGRTKAVFLEEFLPGNDVALLKEKVYNAMEKGLIENKVSWIK